MIKLLIAIISMFLIYILCYVPVILYFKYGFCHKFFHNILGWCKSQVNNNNQNSDIVCEYCGKELTQDSQGNWY